MSPDSVATASSVAECTNRFLIFKLPIVSEVNNILVSTPSSGEMLNMQGNIAGRKFKQVAAEAKSN